MKPEPKPTNIVCTLCGLDWERHTKGKAKSYKVTAEDCVGLLKADLAKRPLSQVYAQVSGTGITPMLAGIPLHGNQIGRAS